MFLKLLICLIGLISITQARLPYEKEYVYNEDLHVSYKIYLDALDWGEARLRCFADNASLVTPKNEAETKVVVDIWGSYTDSEVHGAVESRYMYIGFHDEFTEDQFLAESGHSIDYFYRNFDTDQPNLRGRTENALTIYRSNGKYHDFPSKGRPCAFMCQKDTYQKDLINTIHFNADSGYVAEPVSRKRYKLNTDLQTWGNARTICFGQGGDLAVIRNKKELDFIVEILSNPKNAHPRVKYAFVGLHDMFITKKFTSVKGENVEDVGFVNWGSGEPKVGTNHCVGIDFKGEYYVMNCDALNYYVCEIQPSDIRVVKDSEPDSYLSILPSK